MWSILRLTWLEQTVHSASHRRTITNHLFFFLLFPLLLRHLHSGLSCLHSFAVIVAHNFFVFRSRLFAATGRIIYEIIYDDLTMSMHVCFTFLDAKLHTQIVNNNYRMMYTVRSPRASQRITYIVQCALFRHWCARSLSHWLLGVFCRSNSTHVDHFQPIFCGSSRNSEC